MTPEEALKYLKTVTSARSCRSLEAVYEICQEQVKRGVNDFTVSTIARLGHKRGVPKAQSMRNTTGERYRKLIIAFENQYELTSGTSKKKKEQQDWISSIKDLQLRLQVNIMHSELTRANTIIRELIPPNEVIHIYDGASLGQEEHKLNQLEREALVYLFSDDFLRKSGFSRGENGSVVDSSGKRVFPAATQDALQKALDAL